MTKQELLDRIYPSIYEPRGRLTAVAYMTPEPVRFPEKETGEKRDLLPGDRWGGNGSCA